jgi:hypothetical protein
MATRPNNRLVVLSYLIALIGVLGAFISLLIFLGLFELYGLVSFAILAVAVFSVFAVFSMYSALRKRQWAVLAILFSIIGVLLLTSSTLATTPYSTVFTYQAQDSWSILNETVSIKPNETLTYEHNFYGYNLRLNSTLVQVRISSSSSELTMQLYATSEYRWEYGTKPKPVLNETDWYGGLGFNWRSYYWVPAGDLYENGPHIRHDVSNINFLVVVLSNLDNSERMVYLQVDLFFKGEAQKVTTNYRPLIDTSFAYAGIGLIGMAVIIEAYPSLRKKE